MHTGGFALAAALADVHEVADPAPPGPVLTTITDMCGFLLVLGIATLTLGWL